MSPDAKAELERLQKENPSESTQENLSEEKSAQQDVSEEETVEKKPEEEAISLDELDDLDFSDLEDV